MRLSIFHRTVYHYGTPVTLLPHLLYLRPRENPRLRVESFELTLGPVARLDWMRDDFDNMPACARFEVPAAELSILAECEVTTADTPPFDFLVRDYASVFPFVYEPLHRFNLSNYLRLPEPVSSRVLRTWLRAMMPEAPRGTVAWLSALNQAIFRSVRYARRDEPGIQTAETTIGLGSGTCRDYAALFIAAARFSGVAARFVSGYLFDASLPLSGDMHAWAEVFLPGAGWRGLDPTHGIFCDSAYVPVAHAVVAESINPIQGAFAGRAGHLASLAVEVRVRSREA